LSVFIVVSYRVLPEKESEFKPLMRRLRTYKEENPEKFREVKSWKIFTEIFGGTAYAYKDMMEFESMAEAEKYMMRMARDEGFMRIYQEIVRFIDPATYSQGLWKFFM
jgi:hypothetical protein